MIPLTREFTALLIPSLTTQLSFAEKLGVERHLISAIEGCRQNPSIDLLIVMRRKMNINIW